MGIKSSKRLGNSLIKISLAAQLIGLTSSGLHAAGGDTNGTNKPSGVLPPTAAAVPAEGVKFVVTGNDESQPGVDPADYGESSRALRSTLMANPVLHDLYRELMLQNLSHLVDRSLRKFFKSDPQLAKLYDMIAQQQEEFLNEFLTSADVSMLRLDSNMKGQYGKLYQMFRRIALDQGFAPEAVENLSIFVRNDGGNLNAMTISGSQKHLIIVVNGALINATTPEEVRAIIGHEMGHIRAGHPINGMLLDFMFKLIYRTFANGNIATPAANEGALSIFTKVFAEAELPEIGSATNSGGLEALDVIMHQGIRPEFKRKRTQLMNGMQGGFMNGFSNIPENERNELLMRFLQLTTQILGTMNSPPETLAYFEELTENLNKSSITKLDFEQLKSQLQVLAQLISQADEITADRFGSSQSKTIDLASAMCKLLGLSFGGADRKMIVDAIVRQAENWYAKYPPEVRAYYSGGSHPAPVLRTHMIMNFPVTPDIFFANPFMALLVLQEGLVEQNTMVRGLTVPKVPSGTPNEEAINEQLAAQLKKVQETFAKLQADLDARILHLLMVTEGRYKRNPRFDNMMQLFLFKKEGLVVNKARLEKVLLTLDETESERRVQITNEIKFINYNLANQGNDFLIKVRDAMSAMAQNSETTSEKRESLNKRIEQIDLALTMPDGIDGLTALQALRAELTELPRIRNKGSRIPRPEISRGFSAAACLKSLAGGQ